MPQDLITAILSTFTPRADNQLPRGTLPRAPGILGPLLGASIRGATVAPEGETGRPLSPARQRRPMGAWGRASAVLVVPRWGKALAFVGGTQTLAGLFG
jgi:hypothetical protein